MGLEDANIFYDNLKNKISERTGTDTAVDILEELGLLDEVKVVKCGTPLDTLTHYLATKLPVGKFKYWNKRSMNLTVLQFCDNKN